ncbi:MAG: HPr family phosphocarrier protein [Acidobacteria bacterium]|nr:HPr family phosphocarrier protein [Acidobacteriota bacterium]
MERQDAVIINKLGLHARAAAKVVHAANQFTSSIVIRSNDEEVNAKSILGLLTLAASKGTRITVIADGEDAPQAVQTLIELIGNRFGESE